MAAGLISREFVLRARDGGVCERANGNQLYDIIINKIRAKFPENLERIREFHDVYNVTFNGVEIIYRFEVSNELLNDDDLNEIQNKFNSGNVRCTAEWHNRQNGGKSKRKTSKKNKKNSKKKSKKNKKSRRKY